MMNVQPIVVQGLLSMTTVDFEPLTIDVPLREDPPGVFRVGQSRVLLELVLRAFQRGESAEGIVRSYPTLRLGDVYAVIGRYLAAPAPFDDYLRQCGEQAKSVRREIEAAQRPAIGKKELLARAAQKVSYRDRVQGHRSIFPALTHLVSWNSISSFCSASRRTAP